MRNQILTLITIILAITLLTGCTSTATSKNTQNSILNNSSQATSTTNQSTILKSQTNEDLPAYFFSSAELDYVVKSKSGDLLVTGQTNESFNINGFAIKSQSKMDIFTMQLTNDLVPKWVNYVSGTGTKHVVGSSKLSDDTTILALNIDNYIEVSTQKISLDKSKINEGFVILFFGTQGELKKSILFESTNEVRMSSIIVGNDDSIFVTGYYKGELTYNGAALGSQTNGGNITLKLGQDNAIIWKKNYGGGLLKIDNKQNLYLSASQTTKVTIGEIEIGLPSGRFNGTFLAKIQSNGEAMWAKSINYEPKDFEIDNEENIYLTGSGGTINEDSCHIDKNSPSTAFFILKLNNEGKCVWANIVDGPHSDSGNDIEIDKDGNILFTGRIEGEITYHENSSGWPTGGSANYAGLIGKASTAGILSYSLIGPKEVVVKEINPHSNNELHVTQGSGSDYIININSIKSLGNHAVVLGSCFGQKIIVNNKTIDCLPNRGLLIYKVIMDEQ